LATYYYIGTGTLAIGDVKYSYGQAIDLAKLGGAAELKKLILANVVSAIPTQHIERTYTLPAVVTVSKDERPKWPGDWAYPASALVGLTLAQKNGLLADGAVLLDSTPELQVTPFPMTVEAELDTFLTTGEAPA